MLCANILLFMDGNNDIPPYHAIYIKCIHNVCVGTRRKWRRLHANAARGSDCCKHFSCTSNGATKQATKEAKPLHLDERWIFLLQKTRSFPTKQIIQEIRTHAECINIPELCTVD